MSHENKMKEMYSFSETIDAELQAITNRIAYKHHELEQAYEKEMVGDDDTFFPDSLSDGDVVYSYMEVLTSASAMLHQLTEFVQFATGLRAS